jgi:hypothetical protein
MRGCELIELCAARRLAAQLLQALTLRQPDHNPAAPTGGPPKAGLHLPHVLWLTSTTVRKASYTRIGLPRISLPQTVVRATQWQRAWILIKHSMIRHRRSARPDCLRRLQQHTVQSGKCDVL